jgi:hypothetical protein
VLCNFLLFLPYCCRYQDLVDVGLNIAELVHLEGQDSEDDDDDQHGSGSEVDGTELWEAARALHSDDHDEHHHHQQQLQQDSSLQEASKAAEAGSSSSSSSRSSGDAAVSTPLSSDSNGVLATITAAPAGSQAAAVAADTAAGVGKLRRPGSASSLQQQAAFSSKQGRSISSSKLGSSGGSAPAAAGAKMRLPQSDIASAGSVKEASLRVASQPGPAPRSLSMVRLAAEANRNLTGVEAREKGNVSGGVISAYVAAGGGILIAAWVVLMMAAEQGARVFTDTWLGFWASNAFHQGVWFYIGIYAALGVTYSLITFCR